MGGMNWVDGWMNMADGLGWRMAGLMTVWTDGLGGWMDGMIDRRMN